MLAIGVQKRLIGYIFATTCLLSHDFTIHNVLYESHAIDVSHIQTSVFENGWIKSIFAALVAIAISFLCNSLAVG